MSSSTIPYPSSNPLNYLISLTYESPNATCPITQYSIPSGTLISAQSTETYYYTCGNYDNGYIPAGFCFPLTIKGINSGSVMYYYMAGCTINSVSNYNCMYQFYDSTTQTCGNVKNVQGIFVGSSGTSTCTKGYGKDLVKYTTLTSSPTSLWSKNKGITYSTSLSSCSGTILGYDWEKSSCQTSNDDDNDRFIDDSVSISFLAYCTTERIYADYYYGTKCESKYLMYGEFEEGSVSGGKYTTNPYKCQPTSGQQYTLSIYSTAGSCNSVVHNIDGSLYSKIDCSSKRIELSTPAIVCITFFIPLIFYFICWLIIVKFMKRGDLISKALCLDSNKKKEDLANQEIRSSVVESSSNINRI